MSNANVRRELGICWGEPLSDEQWEAILTDFSEEPESFPSTAAYEKDLLEFGVHCLKNYLLFQKPSTKMQSELGVPVRKTANRGRYARSFRKRWDLYTFVKGQLFAPTQSRILGCEIVEKPTWKQMYEAHKRAIDPSTGLPYDYTPPTVNAFRTEWNRARLEIGNLTEEDVSDLRVASFLIIRESPGISHDEVMYDSFYFIQRKRDGEEPPWRGKLSMSSVGASVSSLMDKQAQLLREERDERESGGDVTTDDFWNMVGALALINLSESNNAKMIEDRIAILDQKLQEFKDRS